MTDDAREQRAEYDRGGLHAFAREHVLGATVCAYGGGGARVRPWNRREDFPRLRRVAR